MWQMVIDYHAQVAVCGIVGEGGRGKVFHWQFFCSAVEAKFNECLCHYRLKVQSECCSYISLKNDQIKLNFIINLIKVLSSKNQVYCIIILCHIKFNSLYYLPESTGKCFNEFAPRKPIHILCYLSHIWFSHATYLDRPVVLSPASVWLFAFVWRNRQMSTLGCDWRIQSKHLSKKELRKL